MSGSIFPVYHTPENRVTASILAVLRSLSLGRCERILAALLEQSEFELIRFQNQPSKGSEGVPDVEISSNFRILIETKIKPNAVDQAQLARHLQRFIGGREQTQRLLVLTPDSQPPRVIDEMGDPHIRWASFAALYQAIEDLFADKDEVISEREAFLLRELQGMLEEEGLTPPSEDVVVIPGKDAWPEYNEFHAYVCQARRSFRQVNYMAFYTKNEIRELIPQILKSHEEVRMTRGIDKGELDRLVTYLLDKKLRTENVIYKVVFLTPPEDPRTVRLENPIINDQRSAGGRITAFTQNQRYVALDALKRAKRTSDLS